MLEMSACRVRCAQVTIEGMELYDAVHWTVHIEHSETVAINNCNIWGDPLIPNSAGIVIDGSKRVYLGENTISTADNAITVRTTQGQDQISNTPKSLPMLLLVDLFACHPSARPVQTGRFLSASTPALLAV